ncbi:MAG TPA: hypothetical protein VKA16_09955 [Burkholderiales bacterium]|nr:hypothetical protein [Burkholderiales bacterium]
MPLTLGAAVLSLGCLAALGAMTGQIEPALHKSAPAATATAVARCGYCGVVERVREIDNKVPKYGVSTVSGGRDQMIVMLLSALSGTPDSAGRPKIYEVSVRMDDGAIRAVRGWRIPEWKPGDRVKVVKGQVESLS